MAHLHNSALPHLSTGAGATGELLPRETRDSLVSSLTKDCIFCVYCIFTEVSCLQLVRLQLIISTQSSVSLASAPVKTVLLSSILQDASFWLLWGTSATKAGLSLQQQSHSCRVRGIWDLFGGEKYMVHCFLNEHLARWMNEWTHWMNASWKNNIYRIFVSLPSFYLHPPKHLVGVTVVITATNSISSKNQNWFVYLLTIPIDEKHKPNQG